MERDVQAVIRGLVLRFDCFVHLIDQALQMRQLLKRCITSQIAADVGLDQHGGVAALVRCRALGKPR